MILAGSADSPRRNKLVSQVESPAGSSRDMAVMWVWGSCRRQGQAEPGNNDDQDAQLEGVPQGTGTWA